ncbi:MAG: hypothetical protein L6Q97_02960 [Thermoanaerobaculia bacterium]|nr:hypothetical protein [Thermoanaerobaculia bacterium]
MHKRLSPFFGLLLPILFLAKCQKQSSVNPVTWYETLRANIQGVADLAADTTHFEYLADSTFSHRTFIRAGRVFREEWYGKAGDLQGISLFTPDGKFELRREICPDRSTGFEGILFKNKFYGPCAWWHCNGRMRQYGFRYANREIGAWLRWDENGVLVDSVDRGNHQLLDSLHHISPL